MAKVRVYELARELNIESKQLVEKLVTGGMDIKNYMSTLDDNDTVRAREIVFGKKAEVIEERRIRPTVIRRRKKVVEAEKTASEEKPAEAAEGEDVASVEEKGVSSMEDKKAEEKKKEGREEHEAAEQIETVSKMTSEQEEPDKGEGVETKPLKEEGEEPLIEEKTRGTKPKKQKRKKGDKPAKIIKRPEEGPLVDILKQDAKKEEGPIDAEPEILQPQDIGIVAPVDKADRKKPGKKKDKKRPKNEVDLDLTPPIKSRKKEIYEKADLYSGRGLKRKEKKRARQGKEGTRKRQQTQITVPKAIKRRIKVQEFVTPGELAKAMGIKIKDVMKVLMGMGHMEGINAPLDFETASLMADEFGYELELDSFEEGSYILETEDKEEDLVQRPPVITIMGHVDHGKTSLLDYIRESNIIDRESGGITQHIGAYYVATEGGDIVFLDTPGHEAFTAMRLRGARITDLIVLVVAADDGVMPQTREAINHARAADIPIVVAINKMDKAGADPDKIKRELAELDLVPEEWGGETIYGNISAKTGEGVDDLLNLILLQAEILELKANPNKSARGSVLEAKLDKSRGPVATVLIKSGTLHQGDFFICGEHYGRVRAIIDQKGVHMEAATPSHPSEIYGISGVPMAGDEFIVVKDEKTAKMVIESRKAKSKDYAAAGRALSSLDDLFARIKEEGVKELNIIIKADVQGSLEALAESLEKQSTDEVKVKIVHSGTGAITESDIMLASTSGAIVIGFNVRSNPRAVEISENQKVDIRYYDVIYDAVNDVRLAMTGLLEPVFKELVIGRASIKETFRVPKIGAVAGCQVLEGHVDRNAKIRLLRDDVVVFDGNISSLRRFKEDVKEVKKGYDCGIGLEKFQDIKPGDIFEVYQVQEEKAEL